MISFSLITCTYNAAAELPPTIKSVEAQTYQAVEHLIIDGASTDETLSMVETYRERAAGGSHQVVIRSERDRGLYDAMNKALSLATGDYLVFLNAGDSLPAPDTLERIAEGIEAAGYRGEKLPGVLYGQTHIVDSNRQFVGQRHLTAPDKLSWRSFRWGMLVCHQAFYVRTDLVRSLHYDLRYRYSADFDWCIRVLKKCEEQGLAIHNTHLVVADFLQGGMTTEYHHASLKERYHVMCRHYGTIPSLFMHGWFAVRALSRKFSS